jgi:hypothetical protein
MGNGAALNRNDVVLPRTDGEQQSPERTPWSPTALKRDRNSWVTVRNGGDTGR